MSYSHSHIDEPAPFEPPINAEVEDEFDELDAVEVHYEEFHEPRERIKEIVPNTSSYDHNNVKCSFDYETGFGAFVDRTVESEEFEKPCQKAAYHSPNEYYDTFLHWINQQADDNDKMLLAFSKHFQSIEYLLDPPSYATGKLNFSGQLPNFVRPNQKIQLTILEPGGDGKWYETDAYCDATLLNVPDNKSANLCVDILKFRINKLQKWMASKHAPFDTDAKDQDDADEDLEWDQDAANALGKFVELSRQPGRKMCNILWKGDDTAMQRTLNCLNTIKHLSMVDSNTAMWRLKLKEKETGNKYIDKASGMPLRPLNETAPQISEPIRHLLICGKHRDLTATCQYYDIGANRNDLFDSCRLNGCQQEAVRLSEMNFISIIQGPPGTGKTSTATCIIRRAFALDQGQKILITAPSNTAVDNIIRALLKSVENAGNEKERVQNNIVRLTSRAKYYQPDDDIRPYTMRAVAMQPENLAFCKTNWRQCIEMKYGVRHQTPLTKEENKKADACLFKYEKQLLRCKYRIIFTTCNGAADARLKPCFFKLVLIDEAAQDTEPTTLIPVTRLHISGRVTLLGDPCQLGPCVTSKEAEQKGFSHTLFERLFNMNMPYKLLNQQYRMHPTIGSIVSSLTYENRVQNCTTKEQRMLQLPKSFPTMMTGHPIAWIHITKEESADDNSRSLQNIGEAIACINLAASLIGQYKMSCDDIVIITSYSAQVKQLRAKVEEACKAILNGTYLQNHSYSRSELFVEDLRKIRIGTVDGFQAQESDIVIYDIVRSNQYLTIGFLENFKRLNVAISRARCLLVVVGNATMFPLLEAGKCFIVNKDQINTEGRRHWRKLLEWCIKHRCILDAVGKEVSLPFEATWPCIGDQHEMVLVRKMMSTPYALTVGIREHLVNEFPHVVMPILVQNHCQVYMAPVSTYVAGWAEIVVSDVQQTLHNHVVNIITNNLRNYDEMRVSTRNCFVNPSDANWGVTCRSWKSQIFKNDLQLPNFMDNWHYRDANYAVSHGIKVLSRHIVVWHIHLCHDIFRLMVGQLTKQPYSIYDEYKKHHIRLITEDGQIATVYEFMCGYLTTTRGYRPKEDWSLETAYNYFVRCLRDILVK